MGLFEREDDATMTAGCNGPAISVIESESDHPSLNRMLGPHLIDERLSAVAGSWRAAGSRLRQSRAGHRLAIFDERWRSIHYESAVQRRGLVDRASFLG